MGRKVSIGVVGSGGGLGTIVAGGTGNTLTTAVTNQNLIIDPNGTGITQIIGATQLNAQSELRLADTDSSNYIALRAAGTISSNYTLTWPAATTAVAGYALTSAVDGTLSWTSLASGGVSMSDPGSTATVHYPVFITNAGSISTTQVTGFNNRSNLSFVPSTGELRHAILTGGTAASATLTLRSTTDATKGQVYIDETTSSSSSTTGALRVGGGAGIGGALNTAGKIKTTFGSGADLTNSTSNMEIEDNGGTSRPSLAFHRPGVFASKITFNTDNAYYFGGWSAGSGASPIVCGGVNPGANNSYDLGTTSLRWRNIYTQDLHLSNGIGDYTVIEGEENLYLVNNKTNKSFKFALIAVDASEVPPKSQT